MSRSPRPEPDFLKSVLGTKFRDMRGKLISKVGKPWPGRSKIAIITASNPNFKTVDAAPNERANAQLRKILEAGGKKFQTIKAYWPDESAFEQSFVVEGMTHGEARELCRKFRQGGYFYANRNHPVKLVLVSTATE